ncbi:inositol-pentakisphosphate 2-kinase [Tuber indicum]|nr:inositol-pentakisphosphate 2-kinase [Tuber indicum]
MSSAALASPPDSPTDATSSTSVPPLADLSSVSLLSEDLQLTYLAEGAANIIYRLSAPPGAPPADEYVNRLLRLRKALPSAQPNLLAYSHLLHTFHPLFPSHLLVPTTLIRVPKSVILRENVNLLQLENAGKRPAKRRGLYLEEETEDYGFVILDMSPRPVEDLPPTPPDTDDTTAPPIAGVTTEGFQRKDFSTRQILVEFKPKWVVQSPSAPANWRRCRTCALRLQKNGGKPSFCPLDLSSREESRVRDTLQHILPSIPPKNLQLRLGETWEDAKKVIEDRTVDFLVSSELMPLLKRLQLEMDPLGPIKAAREGSQYCQERFITAMTVRDLTIFLRIDLDGSVEARIGDLDLKTGEAGKWDYWSKVEQTLITDGYYTGTEEGASEKGVWCKP